MEVFAEAPTKFHEIKFREDASLWYDSMNNELKSLITHNTWTIQPLPPNSTVLPTIWAYKLKRHADGTIFQRKSRLCVQGQHQVKGRDYNESFSPVMSISSHRILLHLAATYDLDAETVDIDSAFVQSDIDCNIYLKPPPGIHLEDSSHVLHLNNALYGLCQSPLLWFNTLSQFLLDNHYIQSEADSCVFHSSDHSFYFGFHVDDILLVGTPASIKQFKSLLSTCFKFKEQGPVSEFLQLKITHDRPHKTFLIHQPGYTQDLFELFDMKDCTPCSLPMQSNLQLTPNPNQATKEDIDLMRSLVVKLLHLSLYTRPDISFAVNKLGRFQANPSSEHIACAKRIIRYLKGTPNHGLLITGGGLQLNAFSDADHAADQSRKSTSGNILMLGQSTIYWHTKLQSVVATSSTEAELIAMTSMTKEVIWTTRLLNSLNIPQSTTPIHIDNTQSLKIVNGERTSQRTKHLDVEYMFIRQHLKAGLITAKHLSTTLMPADTLTKALGSHSFKTHNKFIGITNSTQPEENSTREGICQCPLSILPTPAMQHNEMQNAN